MIPALRDRFTRSFSETRYRAMVEDIDRSCGSSLDFRICETPLFIPEALLERLQEAAADIIRRLQSPQLAAQAEQAVPAAQRLSGEEAHPPFINLDFALAAGPEGSIVPRLIELQAFPTTFYYEMMLDEKIRQFFDIPAAVTMYFNRLDRQRYGAMLRRLILGDHDPENVILLDYRPERQKTRIDFICTEQALGIRPIGVRHLRRRGRKLFYPHHERWIPVSRIYNRLIWDEAGRDPALDLPALFGDAEVEWVSHPNWFFKISKYLLPLLSDSPYCPVTHFLHELTAGPEDLENYVLKPLYSFAGKGVEIDVTPETLAGINAREQYILQQKVAYTPLIDSPEGLLKGEIRLIYFWEAGAPPRLVSNFIRFSRGSKMGGDANKHQRWAGSTIAYFPVQ